MTMVSFPMELPYNKAYGNLVFPQCFLSSYVSGIPALWVVQWFPVMFPLGFFFLYSKEMNHRHLLIMEAELQMVQTTLLLINE
jgi:hypothetical protein